MVRRDLVEKKWCRACSDRNLADTECVDWLFCAVQKSQEVKIQSQKPSVALEFILVIQPKFRLDS